jgi:hypothetical protein
MDYYYEAYCWTERKHKTTGKILNKGWQPYAEYDSEESAREDLANDKMLHPNLKLKLVKKGYEVLFNDAPEKELCIHEL